MLTLRKSIEEYSWRFDEEIRKASSEKIALEALRMKKRWLCKNDLYYLACLTGHDNIGKWPSIYQPFCDEVSLQTWRVADLGLCEADEDLMPIDKVTDDRDNDMNFMKRLFLCYRAFYKTSIITKIHSLQLLLNYPNIHLVLCHNKQENSSDNLVAVKNYFTNTEIGRLFSHCVPPGKEWGNASGFSLKNRTDWGAKTEDNIEAVGVDTEVTGRHWTLAKKNDLVTEKSVTTEEQIKKTAKWDDTFNTGLFMDPQYPLQDYEGTNYHYSDLYTALQEDPSIKVVKIKVLKDVEAFLAGDDSQVTHPERWSRQGIIDKMKDQWVFNCQMMLEPKPSDEKKFNPDMIRRYGDIPERVNNVLLVDPANEKKKRSDYTAMTTVGVGKVNKYIIDLVRDKFGPDERINKAVELILKHNIKDVAWEKIGLNNDVFYLRKKLKEKKIFNVTVHEITTQTTAKNDRIRDILVPQYNEGEWLWPQEGAVSYYSTFERKTIDPIADLKLEFLQFPYGKHDDMLDTQTFLAHLNVDAPPDEPKKGPDELTFGNYIKMNEEKKQEYLRNPYERLDFKSRV
jgi:phage terminase large subunit-like protein